jgi:hypothetical protein
MSCFCLYSSQGMAQKTKVDSIICAYMLKCGDLDTIVNTVHKEKGHLVGDINYALFKVGVAKVKKHALTIYKFSGNEHDVHYLVIDMNNYKAAEILVGADIEADIPKLFAFLKAQYGELTTATKVETLKLLLKYY